MSKIRVALRLRPLSEREVEGGFPVVVAVEDKSAFITDIRVPERPKADSRARYRQFGFDHAFWLEEDASKGAAQSEIYREMGPPLERSVLQGYNACLLAYGQSGTGKTHTMLGSKTEPGLIPRLCHNLWDKLMKVKEEALATGEGQGQSSPTTKKGEDKEDVDNSFKMEVSFMEIYREKVRDLLAPDGKLKLREHPQYGPHVQNLSRVEVTGEMGLLDLLWEGECRRAIGTTGSNRRSSRSHAIWTIYLTRRKDNSLITNQVHLVDLAGSERAGFVTAKNQLAEGADINRSLVALGNVISSLAEKAQYIPYRDSALTWLLKDSIGGNATTAIIITASPASVNHAQTLNSFRFAQRARLVENSPRINISSNPGSLVPGPRSSSVTASATAAIYSIMSAFEIKKDISRLSRIIQSAQNSGGLLRGLVPRPTWTRLVHAIESWNQIETEHVKLQRAASSEDSSTETTFTPMEKSDANIQTNMTSSEEPTWTTPPSTAASSKQSSPTKIMGTEVFIPCSNSIKCLTWQQEEAQVVPKPPSPDSAELDDEEYCSFKMTPPPTPSLIPKIHHMKYMLPVKVPTSHHLDHAARISERIHGSFSGEMPPKQQVQPMEVGAYLCEGDSLLVKTERVPTRVDPEQLKQVMHTCTGDRGVMGDQIKTKLVSIQCKSVEDQGEGFKDESIDPSNFNNFHVSHRPPPTGRECVDSSLISQEEVEGQGRVEFVTKKYKMGRGCEETVPGSVLPEPVVKIVNFAKRTKLYSTEKMDNVCFRDEIQETPRISNNRLVEAAAARTKYEFKRFDKPPQTSLRGFHAPEVRAVPSLETVDDSGDFESLEEITAESVFRVVPLGNQVSKRLDFDDDEAYLFGGDDFIPYPSPSSSRSSSTTECFTQNFNPIKKVEFVHAIPEESEIFEDFEQDSAEEIVNDFVSVAAVTSETESACSSLSILEQIEFQLPPETEEFMPRDQPNQTVDGATDSKFRNHWAIELHQIERMGQQIRQLQQMSKRFHTVKPYLDKISQLKLEDHSQPDAVIDAEIESCCGWNMDIEFQKVATEFTSLNKVLRTGVVPSPGGRSANGGSLRRDSTTSTTTAATTTTSGSSPKSTISSNTGDYDQVATESSSRRSLSKRPSVVGTEDRFSNGASHQSNYAIAQNSCPTTPIKPSFPSLHFGGDRTHETSAGMIYSRRPPVPEYEPVLRQNISQTGDYPGKESRSYNPVLLRSAHGSVSTPTNTIRGGAGYFIPPQRQTYLDSPTLNRSFIPNVLTPVEETPGRSFAGTPLRSGHRFSPVTPTDLPWSYLPMTNSAPVLNRGGHTASRNYYNEVYRNQGTPSGEGIMFPGEVHHDFLSSGSTYQNLLPSRSGSRELHNSFGYSQLQQQQRNVLAKRDASWMHMNGCGSEEFCSCEESLTSLPSMSQIQFDTTATSPLTPKHSHQNNIGKYTTSNNHTPSQHYIPHQQQEQFQQNAPSYYYPPVANNYPSSSHLYQQGSPVSSFSSNNSSSLNFSGNGFDKRCLNNSYPSPLYSSSQESISHNNFSNNLQNFKRI